MQNIKTHLFSYNYKGSQYSVEIPAESMEEAKERLALMPFAKYDGELIMKISATPSTGLLVRLITFIRNRL